MRTYSASGANHFVGEGMIFEFSLFAAHCNGSVNSF